MNPSTGFHYTEKHLREMAEERAFGKTAKSEYLQKEFRKRKVSTQRFFVVRNRSKKNVSSKIETEMRPLVFESDHTVSKGKKI